MYVRTDELLRLVWRGLEQGEEAAALSVMSFVALHLRSRVVSVPDPLVPHLQILNRLKAHASERTG